MNKRTIGQMKHYIFYALLAIMSGSCRQNVIDAQDVTRFDDKGQQLDSLIGTYAAYNDFNGAVLVAKEGKVIYSKGLGWANMEWDVPNQTNTKFRIGSITKQFTAMLIMQLVSENKIDLNAPISTYLPEYPKDNADKITVHQLLTHTSGTPNSYESTKKEAIRPDSYTAEDLVNEFSALPLEFTPGEKFSYSNSGYTVLGHIIETVTGKKYEEVLQDRIFTPLHMDDTGFDKHRPILNNRAQGYFKSWGEYYNANYLDMSTVYSAGALYSTVEDLYLWNKALYTQELLPKKYMDLVFSEHISDPDYGGHYGYGWSVKDKLIGNSTSKVKTVGHDGVIDGFCAVFTRIPSSKTAIILLSNIRRSPLNAMTKGILGILYDKPYDFPKKSVAYSFLEAIDSDGLKKGMAHYDAIKGDKDHYLSEEEMNIISYKLLQSDRKSAAAEVLKLGIEAYPKAFNLYDSYGEVLLNIGDTVQAITNYKKSIQLNPRNEHGLKVLKELEINTSSLENVNLNLLDADSTWGQEIFIFPIHFAPDIKYEGSEDIRFAEGWAKKESNDFWAYAFAWSVKADTLLSPEELETNLQIYFDGLMQVVNKDENKILPKTRAQLQKGEDVIDKISYTGKIDLYDAFSTKKQLTLNVQVDNHYLSRKKKALVLFRFSPKAFDNDIWKKLNQVRLDQTILEN